MKLIDILNFLKFKTKYKIKKFDKILANKIKKFQMSKYFIKWWILYKK